MGKEANFDFSDLLGDNAKLIQGGSTEQIVDSTETESSLEQEIKQPKSTLGNIEFVVGKNPEIKDDEDEEIVDETEDDSDEDKNTFSSDDTKDASGSFALALAKFQQEEGVISEFDEEQLNKIVAEEGEVGALRYLLELQKEAIYEEAKATYAADQAELKEYFDLKDAGVDLETARELAFNKKQFTSITEDSLEEDENLRKSILTQHYKATTSFNDAKIKKEIEKTFNSGADIEEAKDALKELKVLNEKQIVEAKKQVELQEKKRAEQVKSYQEDFKKFVYEKDEFFKDNKINKQTKDKIIDMVLKPAATDANGNALNAVWAERAKDPKKFDAYIAMHILNGTLYGDLGKIKTKAKTSAVTELERQLESKNKHKSGKTVTRTTETSVFEQFLRG